MATYITINGIAMSEKEYKEYKKNKNKELFDKLPKYKQKAILAEKKAARKRKESEIQILAKGVESMVSNVGVISSLAAYYKHGYRQWGIIARNILNEPTIKKPFEDFYLKEKRISAVMGEIKQLSKRSSKAIFERIERLSYELDDAKTIMEELKNAVGSSGVIAANMGHECICGEDKRLGLRTLMSRTYGAIKELERIIKEFSIIARNGI